MKNSVEIHHRQVVLVALLLILLSLLFYSFTDWYIERENKHFNKRLKEEYSVRQAEKH